MSDKKLPPAENAARDRIYAFLAGCPEVMDFLNEKDEDLVRNLLDNPAKLSIAKIFVTVAVREMWVQNDRPIDHSDCPVGDWPTIDKFRLEALGDVRIQCAKLAVDLCNEHDGQAVDIRIATEKMICEIEENAKDSALSVDITMAKAISILLPAVSEKMIALAKTMEDGGEVDFAELLQAYDAKAVFNPTEADFLDKVLALSKGIFKSAKKDMEDKNNG